MRKSIPAAEKLAVTLNFLAYRHGYKNMDASTKLSDSFLQKNIIEICEVIYNNMKDEFLKFPTLEEEWIQIATQFESRWQFPLCIGALDGKHISFRPPLREAPLYYNYKSFKSVVLLAMADAFGKFIFIDVGCSGRISDGGVLNRSNLMEILLNDEKYLPKRKVIGNERLLPYVIVADNAFPLFENIMTSYPYTTTERCKQIFNRRLSRARQNIERAFGIFSNRFQILEKTIKLNKEKTIKIVQCCCVLHNFLISHSHWYSENIDNTAVVQSTNIRTQDVNNSNRNKRNNEDVRKLFMEYFCNEGKIDV